MTPERFSQLVQKQFEYCSYVLSNKDGEYSTETDRLHNFKQAAYLQQTTPRKALAGMMAKHTVSIYDACMSDQPYTVEFWLEKITDSINYFLLLKGILEDERAPQIQMQFEVDVSTHLQDLEAASKWPDT